jgi:hypothetical protein
MDHGTWIVDQLRLRTAYSTHVSDSNLGTTPRTIANNGILLPS